MLAEELQVLVLVLAECLSDLGVFDDIEHGLRFLLETLVGGDRAFTLCGKLCAI